MQKSCGYIIYKIIITLNIVHTKRMLDKVSVYVLSVIKNACLERGGYVVLEVDEIVKNSPANYGISQEKLVNIVKLLSGLGYVNLRYLSGKEFCLSITSSGKNYIKDIKVEKKTKINYSIKVFLLCFLGGFLGGILGSLIAMGLG